MADDMVTADWIDCLSDLPQEAVARAFRERLRSPDRRRPLPGEIRAMAVRHLKRLPTRPTEPAPFGRVVSAEELERRRQVVEQMAAEFPMLRRAAGTTAEKIIAAVEDAMGVEDGSIIEGGRQEDIYRARHMAVGLTAELLGYGPGRLARAFGKDRTTAANSERRCRELRETDAEFADIYDQLREALR